MEIVDRLITRPLVRWLDRRGVLQKSHPAWQAIYDDLRLVYTSDYGIGPEDVNYEQFLKSVGYFSWVQACVKAIASAAASAPLVVEDPATGELLEQHPLIDKFHNPNPDDGHYSFWYKIHQQLSLTGNCFIALDGDVTRLDSVELWVLRSDYVTIDPSESDAFPVKNYIYTNRLRKKVLLDPEQVIHFKFPHQYDHLYGLSPLAELECTLRLLWAALNWNKEFFRNGAQLAGVLQAPAGLGGAEFERFEEQFRQRHVGQNATNRRSVAILEGDAKWTQTGATPGEADFLQLLDRLRNEIHAVLRVPPIQSGILEYASYANARVQDAMFYNTKIEPDNRLLTDHLNSQPIVMLQGVKLCHTYDHVDALREDEDAISNRDRLDAAEGIRTINEIREERGIGDPVPWGNAPRWALMLGIVDVDGNVLEEEEEPEPPPMPQQEPGEDMAEEENEAPAEEEAEEAELGAPPLAMRMVPRTKAEREIYYRAFLARTESIEGGWRRDARKGFRWIEDRVMGKIAALQEQDLAQGTPTDVMKVLAADVPVPAAWAGESWFSEGAFAEEIGELFKARGARTMKIGAADLAGTIGTAFALEVVGEVEEFLKEWTGKRVRNISETQRESISKIVAKSIKEGETVRQLAGRLRKHFTRMAQSRAQTIARTETIGLYNAGGIQAMRGTGVTEKEWLATPDDATRESHRAANGQRVPVDADFTLRDGSGPFPGAINAASENVNCRCSVLPVV